MLDVTVGTHDIRIGERFSVTFQRTLRIPDDGRTYPLPPGLGLFPLSRIDDYPDRVPSEWRATGGAFLPMYQREAMWLGFRAAAWKPNAVKVAVGRVNVISGNPFDHTLHAEPQDYLVCPNQLWLDGINTGHETIRQFVAMPLGQQYTIEAAVTGSERFGGIQIAVFEPAAGRFPEQPPPAETSTGPLRLSKPAPEVAVSSQMGLGAGGVMRQKIYPDPWGIATWDPHQYAQVVVYLVNSTQFFEITGELPPPTPIDAQAYTQHGLPWFDLYDEDQGDVAPPDSLTGIKTVADRDAEVGQGPVDDASVDIPETQIKKLRKET